VPVAHNAALNRPRTAAPEGAGQPLSMMTHPLRNSLMSCVARSGESMKRLEHKRALHSSSTALWHETTSRHWDSWSDRTGLAGVSPRHALDGHCKRARNDQARALPQHCPRLTRRQFTLPAKLRSAHASSSNRMPAMTSSHRVCCCPEVLWAVCVRVFSHTRIEFLCASVVRATRAGTETGSPGQSPIPGRGNGCGHGTPSEL
jgi:hypothetical protein